MTDQLRRMLCDIVTTHGAGVADDPARCGELLRQAAPEDGAGVEALLRALETHVPARLALLTEPLSLAPLTSGLVRRLVDEQGLSEEAARWAIESWAVALGKGGDGLAQPGGLPAYAHVLAAPRRRWRFLWYLLPVLALAAGVAGWWWSAQRAEVRRFGGRTNGVYYISLDADRRTLLGACGDWELRLWDVAGGTELQTFDKPNATDTHDVALSPDGRLALWCGGSMKETSPGEFKPKDCVIRIRNLETQTTAAEPFATADVPIFCVAFSPDGRLALAGMGDYDREQKPAETPAKDKEKKPVPKDCVVRLYDLATGKALRDLAGHQTPVWRAVFTPDGRRVVAADLGGSLRLWDVEDGRELKSAETSRKANVISLDVSPDGHRLLTGDSQARVTLWDLDELEPEREYKCSGQNVFAVAFSPDGRRALSGGDDYSLRLFDAETLAELRHFPGHTATIYGAAFVDAGREALSASADGTIRVWKLP
jgi:WD40 repeat protein